VNSPEETIVNRIKDSLKDSNFGVTINFNGLRDIIATAIAKESDLVMTSIGKVIDEQNVITQGNLDKIREWTEKTNENYLIMKHHIELLESKVAELETRGEKE